VALIALLAQLTWSLNI